MSAIGSAASLNWREIDLVLSEIDPVGLQVREIHQPNPHTLHLELGGGGRGGRLLVRLSPPHVRLHLTTSPRIAAQGDGGRGRGPARFAALLRAHVRGGHITVAAQVGRERVVRLAIRRGETERILWLRLWANAGNAILTDPDGRIVDVLYRRPSRGEVAGQVYTPPAQGISDRPYTVRELPGEGTFNQRLDEATTDWERADTERANAEKWLRLLRAEEGRLDTRLEALRAKTQEHAGFVLHKQAGDEILANLHRLAKGDRWLDLEDRRIELDPSRTPAENAQQCFARYKRSRATHTRLAREAQEARRVLDRVLSVLRAHDPAERPPGRSETPLPEDTQALERAARELGLRERRAARSVKTVSTPGLRFVSGPFTILVGRNALESDEILRRHTRGSDTWFHCRDGPGAHVFVRAIPGKSVPLEVMLDAANLAVHHSKSRTSGAADVYYTSVKYLRRPRDGPPGLVLPTHEKNLRVRLEPARIHRLEQSTDGIAP